MNKELFSLYLWELKEYAVGELPANLAYFCVALVLLYIAKLARDLTTRGIDDDHEITSRDNCAFGIYSAGYYLGVGLSLAGVFLGPESPFLVSIVELFQYGLTGIVLMGTSYAISDLVYFKNIKVMDHLVNQNKAVAFFLLGRFIFAGLNVFSAMHGEGAWFVCFVYFLLGEAGCWIGFKVYCLVTPYDDIKSIEQGREAVSIVSAGFMISMGLLATNALWGDFLGYDIMLVNFTGWFFGGLVLLLAFRTIGSKILFPKSDLVQEISNDNNIGAAAIMMSAYLMISAVIVLSF